MGDRRDVFDIRSECPPVTMPKPSKDSTNPLSRRKLWTFRAWTVGGVLVLLLLLVEAALWIFAPLTSNEKLAWIPDGHVRGIPEPNQTLRTAAGHQIQINRLGFRGPDYAWTPPPGTLRLVVFGGSAAFGLDARSEDDTWPRRLQDDLGTALKMPVEVINLGLPGYDASNSKIHYLFTGRAHHPHVVMIYHTWNDLKYFRRLEREPVIRWGVNRTEPWWKRAARKMQSTRRLARLYGALKENEIENSYLSMTEQGVGAALPPSSDALDWARRNFKDFVSFSQSDEVLPVLITQATSVHPDNLDKPKYRKAIREHLVGMTLPILNQTWTRMNDIIEDVASETNAIFVDGYNAVPHDLEHLTDHVHLTDKGRDVLARTISEALLKDPRFLRVVKSVRNDVPGKR
ncbi:MAG: GDSL-type esterase/lipase family protein [Phycisphaerales bacterium]|nr:GDSL-type esterase/lipase family protein [Phycisphaerales bacterium]